MQQKPVASESVGSPTNMFSRAAVNGACTCGVFIGKLIPNVSGALLGEKREKKSGSHFFDLCIKCTGLPPESVGSRFYVFAGRAKVMYMCENIKSTYDLHRHQNGFNLS